jgi:hypothetical protein
LDLFNIAAASAARTPRQFTVGSPHALGKPTA